MEASERLLQVSEEHHLDQGGAAEPRRHFALVTGGCPDTASADGLDDPAAAWAHEREAELRAFRQSEWRHNGTLSGEHEPETTEERNHRVAQETLRWSLEQVPGLRALYSEDPESGALVLDLEKCEEAGEPALQGMLRDLITARLEGALHQDVVFQGSKASVGMYLSTEHMYVSNEGDPSLRIGLAYADPVFRSSGEVEIASREALLFDADSGRFIRQEVSRPWSGEGQDREEVADGILKHDLRYKSFPSGLPDLVPAIGFLAEGQRVETEERE